ncbi:hypothetical protein LXL04_019597 [Taraxacum kok-saghyz]
MSSANNIHQGTSSLVSREISSIIMANMYGLSADPWCKPISTGKGSVSPTAVRTLVEIGITIEDLHSSGILADTFMVLKRFDNHFAPLSPRHNHTPIDTKQKSKKKRVVHRTTKTITYSRIENCPKRRARMSGLWAVILLSFVLQGPSNTILSAKASPIRCLEQNMTVYSQSESSNNISCKNATGLLVVCKRLTISKNDTQPYSSLLYVSQVEGYKDSKPTSIGSSKLGRRGNNGVPGGTSFGLWHYTNTYVGQASVDKSRNIFETKNSQDTDRPATKGTSGLNPPPPATKVRWPTVA